MAEIDELNDGLKKGGAPAGAQRAAGSGVLSSLSPQDADVIVECGGQKLAAHSAVLRRQSKLFAVLLEGCGPPLWTSGPSAEPSTIPLPLNFPHSAQRVREFLCVLSEGAKDMERSITSSNAIALAQMAHYFDAPVLHAACDEALATRLFSELQARLQIPHLMQVALRERLPRLEAACFQALARELRDPDMCTTLAGTELTDHFSQLRGGELLKTPQFMAKLALALDAEAKRQQRAERKEIAGALNLIRVSIQSQRAGSKTARELYAGFGSIDHQLFSLSERIKNHGHN